MIEQDIWQGQSFVIFDIETIPRQDPAYLEECKRNVTAPAQYKKPESIEKWLAENRDTAAQEAVDKTSFDATKGHVCTIAWAKNGGDVRSRHARTVGEEKAVIEAFFGDLDPYHSETLAGHYITGFDIPFLIRRAIVLGVTLPPRVTLPRDPKPWDKGVFDTMSAWAGARDRISMDSLCQAFGIAGKGEFDGSQVGQAWKDGQHAEIEEYCRDDVRRTREILKRFLEVGF